MVNMMIMLLRAIGYENIRGLFIGNTPKDQAPLWAKMASGMSAGAIGQAIAVPMDLIKVYSRQINP